MTESMDELSNKFRESAENFSLIPSAGIWLNVEDDIRKRKRKRRFIIFFFGIAILTAGMFLFINDRTIVNNVTEQGTGSRAPVKDERTQQENAPVKKKNERVKENDHGDITSSETSKPIVDQVILHKQSQPENAGITTASSEHDNTTTDHSIQPDTDVTISATFSFAVTGNISPDSIIAVASDTLHNEIKTDSLVLAKADTVSKDTTIEAKTPQSKWSIVLTMAPAISFTQPGEKGDHQFISNYRDSTDKTLLRWNYHFAIHHKITPALEVLTGIGIIKLEQEILNKQLVYDYDTLLVPIVGPAGPDTIIILDKSDFNINGNSTGTIKNKFSYLAIPFGSRFSFLPGHKFNIALQPEISFHKIIRHEGYRYNFETFTYEKIKRNDVKKWLVAYGAGVSFQYQVHKNLCIEFTPCYKNYHKSVFKDSYAYSQRFQQIEFRTSLKYIFK